MKGFGSLLSTVFGFLTVDQPKGELFRDCHLASQMSSLSMVDDCHVCVVGSANQDVTVYLPSSSDTTKHEPYPLQWGETVIANSEGRNSEMSCGGKGANQAVAAASFFPVTSMVHMVCRVGKDAFGKTLLDGLKDANVGYDEVLSDSSTGMASILVDGNTGDNMIVVVPGANHDLHPSDVKIPKGCRVLLTQLEIPLETAIHACQMAVQSQCLSICNPAPCNFDDLPDELFHNVDILIPNQVELKSLCQSISTTTTDDEETLAKRLLLEKKIRRAVIVTLGDRGALIVARNNNINDELSNQLSTVSVPIPTEGQLLDDCGQPLPVVDTVGAGDAFCGALAAHLSSSSQPVTISDIVEASTKACGFASMSVRKRGAQSSYPKYDELPDYLKISNQDNRSSSSSHPQKIPLTFVTGNVNKLKEVQKIMMSDQNEQFPFTLTNVKLDDLPEVQGRDPIEIAKEKCKWAAQHVDGPVLIEDTSLCFVALNNLPGPYIKWFLESCGHDGLNKMLAGFEDKSAYAQTICAVCFNDHDDADDIVHIAEGRTYGTIVPPRGDKKFGWDPIFQPNEGGGQKTYAQMTMEEKNAISHRARALANLKELLQNYASTNVKSQKS